MSGKHTPGPCGCVLEDGMNPPGVKLLHTCQFHCEQGFRRHMEGIEDPSAVKELIEAARWVMHNIHGISLSGENFVSDEEQREAWTSLNYALRKLGQR